MNINYYICNVIKNIDMIIVKKGDIFANENEWDALIHGCNCYCTMGAGIAKTIKEKYPEAYKADCKTVKGDKTKIGSITTAHSKNKWIINAYTQVHYNNKGNMDLFNYIGFRNILKNVVELIKKNYNSHYTLAMPKIGAGLAGGNWSIIEDIIEEECKDINVIIYYL